GRRRARGRALPVAVLGAPVAPGGPARGQEVSARTLPRLIVGMERAGLVRREAGQRDGRLVWLQATPKGTRLLHEGRQRRVAALADDLNRLSDADRATLAAAAEILERMLAGGSPETSQVRRARRTR